MAITQAMCTSFKSELMNGEHDLNTDVIKIALFTSAATLSAATTAYATTNEITGTGYTAGGNTLTATATYPKTAGTTGVMQFNDSTWSSATFTCRGAVIYNSSNSNKAIAVLDFGNDVGPSSGDFTVDFDAGGNDVIVIS